MVFMELNLFLPALLLAILSAAMVILFRVFRSVASKIVCIAIAVVFLILGVVDTAKNIYEIKFKNQVVSMVEEAVGMEIVGGVDAHDLMDGKVVDMQLSNGQRIYVAKVVVADDAVYLYTPTSVNNVYRKDKILWR